MATLPDACVDFCNIKMAKTVVKVVDLPEFPKIFSFSLSVYTTFYPPFDKNVGGGRRVSPTSQEINQGEIKIEIKRKQKM